MATANATKPKKIKAVVHSKDGQNKETEVFVGVNGKTFQIQLGVEVELDEKLISVLRDAVEIKHESVKNKKGELTGEIVEKKEPRYIVEKI